jgi:hypothetical protein
VGILFIFGWPWHLLIGFLVLHLRMSLQNISIALPLFPEKMESNRENSPLAVFHHWPPFLVHVFHEPTHLKDVQVLHGSGIRDPHGQRVVGQFYRKWVVSSPQNMANLSGPRIISGLPILESQHIFFFFFFKRETSPR